MILNDAEQSVVDPAAFETLTMMVRIHVGFVKASKSFDKLFRTVNVAAAIHIASDLQKRFFYQLTTGFESKLLTKYHTVESQLHA